MSLLGKIAAFFSGGSTCNTVVVDGDRLAGGDRVGPGERFQALNRLARYTSREEINAKVVFGGRPLREAGEGETFNGVQVFYAETADEVRARLSKLARSGSSTVLVTSDQSLEADLNARGVTTMRLSTLRKAMEAGSPDGGGRDGGGRDGGGREGGGRGERDRDGGRRGRGRSRRRGDRGPRPQQEEGGSGSSADGTSAPRSETPSNAGGGSSGADNSVKNLIDLVE